VNAAAHLLHAYDGLKVALHGSTPDVLAGEMHVDMVAEEAAVDTLAELVLGVHDALYCSLAYPPRGVAEISLATGIAPRVVHAHI
jgi:hypothetical protein